MQINTEIHERRLASFIYLHFDTYNELVKFQDYCRLLNLNVWCNWSSIPYDSSKFNFNKNAKRYNIPCNIIYLEEIKAFQELINEIYNNN